MISLLSPFRPARIDDAPALADLVDFAGEGLPSYLWAKMAQPSETAMDVGRRRAAREEGAFSYHDRARGIRHRIATASALLHSPLAH